MRHRLVTNVIHELPYGFQVGTIITANSAPPYNITLGTDANRGGDNVDRPAGLQAFDAFQAQLGVKITF